MMLPKKAVEAKKAGSSSSNDSDLENYAP